MGVIFSTQRHLAKSAPSFLYWAHRSYSPSRPGTEAQDTFRWLATRRRTVSPLRVSLTLGGRLAVGPGQGDDTLVHLDAHNHASFFEVLGEGLAIVGLLVHGLMEEDHATDAGDDGVVSREEELPVQPPVLFSVLSIDALEALGHTP